MNDLEYQTNILEEKLGQLIGTLRGSGFGDGEVARAVQVEAGQCAWKIAQQLGPSSSAEANKRLDKELRKYLTDKPTYSNLDADQQYSSTSEFTWISAGPNFLTGINDEDNQTSAGVDAAAEMYYGSRKAGSRGLAYEVLGKRGHQTIQRLNRTRVKPSTLNGVRRLIASKFGQSKAAFARTAAQYLNRAFPAWVTRNIPVVIENGKSILDDTGLKNLEAPHLDFGSRAPGVTTNPKMLAAIRGGIIQSQVTLAAKCRKIVSGLTYNWNTGQVYRGKTQFDDN